MSLQAVREIIGTAIVDQEFCGTLVAGDRAVLLAGYDLLPAERQMLLDIQADSLEAFARQVYDWVMSAHEEPTTIRPGRAGVLARRAPAAHVDCRPLV